jgi:hypothetical protein
MVLTKNTCNFIRLGNILQNIAIDNPTRLGIGFLIVTVKDGLPQVAVYMSSINNHKLSIYPISKSEFLAINSIHHHCLEA